MCFKQMLLLLPSFLCSYFYLAYQSNFLALYFTVRARAFSSLLSPFAGIFSSYIMGYYLDSRRQPAHVRGLIVLVRCLFTACLHLSNGPSGHYYLVPNRHLDMDNHPSKRFHIRPSHIGLDERGLRTCVRCDLLLHLCGPGDSELHVLGDIPLFDHAQWPVQVYRPIPCHRGPWTDHRMVNRFQRQCQPLGTYWDELWWCNDLASTSIACGQDPGGCRGGHR